MLILTIKTHKTKGRGQLWRVVKWI